MKYAFDLKEVENFEKRFYSLRESLMKSNKVFNVYRKTPSEKALYEKYSILSKNVEEFSKEIARYLNEVYAYHGSINKDYAS